MFALVCIFWAFFLGLSLATYDPADPSFNRIVSGAYQVRNSAGLVGSHLGGLLVDLFGVGAYGFAAASLLGGLAVFIRRLTAPWWRWVGLTLFFLCFATIAQTPTALEYFALGDVSGGGFFGRLIHDYGRFFLRPVGAGLAWTFLFIAAVQLLTGASWGAVGGWLKRFIAARWAAWRADAAEAKAEREAKREAKKAEREARKAEDAEDRKKRKEKARKQAARKVARKKKSDGADTPSGLDLDLGDTPPAKPSRAKAHQDHADAAPISVHKAGALPGLPLLAPVPESATRLSKDDLDDQAERVTTCLADFNVQGEIQATRPGPVVTMFEFKPAPGIKVSKIAGLSDDLALALRAVAVRIEAPIPGKDSVGIEIPNKDRETVHLCEILESGAFRKEAGLLTLALGKDISGRPRTADLARMPHLLVAGATGAGKSVCLNSILMSILYKAKPDQVKLLLVDPKRIELAVYADLPHLVHPVVTDMSLAKSALDWAVYEMDRRYEAMAKLGVRNISGYNEKLAALGDDKSKRPEGTEDLEPMPFLVLIIDELADLMLTGAKEVEVSIVRLAQLARAAGIHLILATQRPSVDVVTGLIKANFPCRISFQVTSKHDSRTILDTVGAEHLLGKGDMLFKPSGGRLERMHGCYVSDDDVAAVVDYWKAQQAPDYGIDFDDWQPGGSAGGNGNGADMSMGGGPGGPDSAANDPLYGEALEFVMDQGKASISQIQRRFRIGFNRAARFIEQMEADGILGPADGSKPRQVRRPE